MLLGLGIWLLTGVACQSGPGKGESRPAADKPAAKAWVSHKDPAGFSAQFPEGWQVRTDRATGRVEFQGPQGEQVVVWPIFISQAPAALNATAGAAVLRQHATKLWPNAVWENPQPAGTTAARMRGNSGDRMVVAILTWIPSPKGNAGYLYATTAPKTNYRQTEETFAKILQSFRLVGTATQAAEPALSYVKWHEPRENAFTMDVPSQWRVNGGVVRVSNIDVRGALELLSPDGQIRVTVGDAEIPGFAVPNPTMAMSGIVEGSWYTPGPATTLMVRRYVQRPSLKSTWLAK